MNDRSSVKRTSHTAGALFGTGLILLGIVFLIGQIASVLFNFDLGQYTWPVFHLIPGLLLFLTAFTIEPRPGITLAIIGAMAVITGSILLIQNIFDLYARHW